MRYSTPDGDQVLFPTEAALSSQQRAEQDTQPVDRLVANLCELNIDPDSL